MRFYKVILEQKHVLLSTYIPIQRNYSDKVAILPEVSALVQKELGGSATMQVSWRNVHDWLGEYHENNLKISIRVNQDFAFSFAKLKRLRAKIKLLV